jgi:hypothetical protein
MSDEEIRNDDSRPANPTAPGAVYGPGAPPLMTPDQFINMALRRAYAAGGTGFAVRVTDPDYYPEGTWITSEDTERARRRRDEANTLIHGSARPPSLCKVQHPESGRGGGRIVECGRERGHEPAEEHEEAETGIRWIRYAVGLMEPKVFVPRAEAMRWDGSPESLGRIQSWLEGLLRARVTCYPEPPLGTDGPDERARGVLRITRGGDRVQRTYATEHRVPRGWWIAVCMGSVYVRESV